VQVPFLVDPNTGTELFESGDIVDYLERTYAA
jgi:glutathione S-transferase